MSQIDVAAAIVDAPGAHPRVGSVDLAARPSGSTLLAVLAAPLNALDLLMASGGFHSARHESPYVPGSECVGTVVESDIFEPGTLVYAETHASPTTPGSIATHVVASDAEAVALPTGVDPILAAALGNSGVAAFMPLVEIAGLKAGETVLVLGATGAVGQLAVQVARARGAGRVVGVGRDEATLERVLAAGADAVVALRKEESVEELAARISAAAGPVDVVIDGLYGRPLEAALISCGQGARIVNIGNLAGATAQVPAGLLRGKQLRMFGFAGMRVPFAEKQAALTWMWQAAAEGKLQLDVHTYPLHETPAAWSAQANSPHGKSVILPDPPSTTTKAS